MHTKAKKRLTVILILFSFLVISVVSITAIFALTQQSIKTKVGVEYAPETDISLFIFAENTDAESYSLSLFDSAGLNGTTGVVVIPKTYNNKPVTAISENAFNGCTNLKQVIIQEGVTSIGNSAFFGCGSLTSITIPSSVTSIGTDAFLGCQSLNNVTFENTEGWFTSDDYGAISGTDLNSENLSNKTTAATYLKEIYCGKFWICNKTN